MNSQQVPENPLEQYKRELDETLLGVTSEAVGKAMLGFPLPLASGWDLPRLTTVVRRVLASAPRPERLLTNGHRKSPYFIEQDSLKTIARKAASMAQTLKGLEMSTRGRIMTLGLLRRDAGNQKTGAVPAMQRYYDIVKELEWLTSFLGEIASGISKPSPKWEAAADRDWRIHVGWGLAAVHEAAFAQSPRAHKSESDDTAFMKFFRRMMALAFELGGGGPDFKAIAIAACKRHRSEPAKCDWLLNP